MNKQREPLKAGIMHLGILFLYLLVASCSNIKGGPEVQQENIPVLETGGAKSMPSSWIDRDTGHKLEKVTERPDDNKSFYFHNNPFLPNLSGDGWLMIFYGETSGGRQLFSVDLGTKETRQITHQAGDIRGEIVGIESRKVFYTAGDSVFSTHIDTHQEELICTIPEGMLGSITTLNADEKLLCFTQSSPEEREIYRQNPSKGGYFDRIYEAKLPRSLWTIEIAIGKFNKIYTEQAWLNHVQFSPTDPNRLMYCHEGPWHKVDRIWNIDLETRQTLLLHKRTVHREIAGHEFFSRDGKTVWFDLQIPRGETFFLAGVNLENGQTTRYALERDEWSIHFNISPDQQSFAGDGGDESQVARAKDGKWIYHFTPGDDKLISKRMVNMQHHDYRLEPNVHFSPDGRKVIFRANFEGKSNIYAVDLEPVQEIPD